MKHKYALYPIIVSICALLCFLAVLILFSTAAQPLWGRMALLILPALLLGIVAFCAARGKLNAPATILWTTALTILLLLASVFYVAILSVWTATTTTTDIRYYSRAYAQIQAEAGVNAVFPKTVPAEADDITFSYHPQFLQGGEVFELSYTTTEESLAEWTDLLEKKATWIGSNRDWHTKNDWSFHGGDAARYQLYWDGGFNHGQICYVLIGEKPGRITFYYSQW